MAAPGRPPRAAPLPRTSRPLLVLSRCRFPVVFVVTIIPPDPPVSPPPQTPLLSPDLSCPGKVPLRKQHPHPRAPAPPSSRLRFPALARPPPPPEDTASRPAPWSEPHPSQTPQPF